MQRWQADAGEVSESWRPDTVALVMGVPSSVVRQAIATRLDESPPAAIAASDWRRVRSLYEEHGGVPLWLTEDGLADRVAALTSALASVPTDGLALSAYPISELRSAVEAIRGDDTPSAPRLAHMDVLLSGAYAALAGDMLQGQVDPRAVSQGWHVDAQRADVDSAIARTLRSEPLDRGIARMRPQAADFDGLRDALARYREIVRGGGWQRVPDGAVLEPGDTSRVPRLEALRRRLLVERFIERLTPVVPLRDSAAGATDHAVYDAELGGAVARFQSRHAIAVDSVLGPHTLAALNASAEYRLRQIVGNMERYRWLPRTLGDDYIFVNIPAFRLQAFEDGEPTLSMKVIVGAEYDDRATPAFSDSLSYLVFRPYWNIPTTYVRDGELWFGNDLYDRDDALARAVADAALPDGELQRAAEELHQIVTR